MKTNTEQTKPTLTIERVFKATPEKLWSYWTDPKKYAKWFNPAPIDLVILEFDVKPGGRIRFDMPQPDGNANPQEGVFHKLDPYKEIVSGEADGSFLVRVQFVPMGPNTRMIVTVTGLAAEWHSPATVGWNQGFDKLEALLGGPVIPKTTGPAQPFVLERTFRAPPEKVWRMWTTKEGLEKWFVPDGWTMRVTRLDLRVGGEYEFTMASGEQTVRNHGTYTEVAPPRRLAWTWRFDIFLGPGETPYDVPITVDLEPAGGGTKMTFRQGPLATAEFTEGSRQGVMANFERLAKALGE